MTKLRITQHALKRFTEHWPDARGLGHDKLVRVMRPRIIKAIQAGRKIDTPGGLYVPVSFEGIDGFAVIRQNQVVTFAPVDRCPEIISQRNFF